MKSKKLTITDYEALLADKEHHLLIQRDRVTAFLISEHTSDKTKKYQIAVRKSDRAITAIYKSLIGEKHASAEFDLAAKELCAKCRTLHDYTTDMFQILAGDLTERRIAEEKKTVDAVKNFGLLIAGPVGFAAAVKNGVSNGHITPNEAAAVGLGVAIVGVNWKRLKQTFGAVRMAPQVIQGSFFVFYVKETAKEKMQLVSKTIGMALGINAPHL